jgi:hypothetical protein
MNCRRSLRCGRSLRSGGSFRRCRNCGRNRFRDGRCGCNCDRSFNWYFRLGRRSNRSGRSRNRRNGRSSNRSLHNRLFCEARMLFFGRSRRWLDDNSARRRSHHNDRTPAWRRTCRSLCNHRSAGRPRSNCRLCRRMDNLRRRTRLRNNLARCRRCRSCRSSRGRLCCRRSRRRWRLCRCSRWGRLGCPARMPRFFLFFFLLGQNSLEHIARLGNVRQINFRRYRRSSTTRVATARTMRKVHTYLLCFILLQ